MAIPSLFDLCLDALAKRPSMLCSSMQLPPLIVEQVLRESGSLVSAELLQGLENRHPAYQGDDEFGRSARLQLEPFWKQIVLSRYRGSYRKVLCEKETGRVWRNAFFVLEKRQQKLIAKSERKMRKRMHEARKEKNSHKAKRIRPLAWIRGPESRRKRVGR